jgi:hypothetical protein
VSNNGRYTHRVVPTAHSARGWRDYLDGEGFPPEYDTWNQIEQRHYERGRLRAAGARMIYRQVPEREPGDIIRKTNRLKLIPPAMRGTPASVTQASMTTAERAACATEYY